MNKLRLFFMSLMALVTIASKAQVTPACQMEKLDRGLVAVPTSTTANFVSWRLLGTDDKANTTFDLLRNGTVIASGLTKTNYQDTQGSATAKYQVVTKVNGSAIENSAEVTPWGKKYLSLKLDRPKGGTISNWSNTDASTGPTTATYAYYPNDMSVGDVDGDGQYELFLKWESTHAQDNSRSHGATGNTFIDCYKLDGTRLWRLDLGLNIRDGAHYTQFMVYDFDGDGKAEMMCKTAAGSKDGLGNYVNQAATDETIKGHDNTKDYRNSGGHILSGPEYLTVFDGLTGKAIHTTWYLPGRAGTGSKTSSGSSTTEGGSELGKVSTYPNGFWGDNYGGRSERFLGAVAYINGADKPACGIFCRGYYTKAYVWAVSFDGSRLHTEWLHCSPSTTQWLVYASKWAEGQSGLTYTIDGDLLKRIPIKTAPANTGGVKSTDTSGGVVGSNTLYGNGNHNMSIADVDGDGCDEIIWGAGALNNDGTLLYATGYGHGDAMHVGKMIPDREGYQVFDVHEEKLTATHGSWDLHDARTGEVIYHGGSADSDNGRGMAGDLTGKDGYEFWSSDVRTPYSALTGKATSIKNCSVNFRIYWDGSIQDQLLDGSYKYSGDVWAQTAHAEPVITKWNGSSFSNVVSFYSTTYNNAQTANYTKATPCLQADILGDWREELVMWNKKDSSEIMIFTTWTPTQYAVPTLMHDHTYRMGICWQNTAYNQPPHLGYYLPDYINGKISTGIKNVRGKKDDTRGDNWYTITGQKLIATPHTLRENGKPSKPGIYINGNKKVIVK
jgi:rhamnogalacturonan endolyase